MKVQQFTEGDHVRVRSSNEVVSWLQGEKGRVESAERLGHTFVYSIRLDVAKRGRTMANRLLQHKLEKA